MWSGQKSPHFFKLGRQCMVNLMTKSRHNRGWLTSQRVNRGSQCRILIAVGRRSDRAGSGRSTAKVQGAGARWGIWYSRRVIVGTAQEPPKEKYPESLSAALLKWAVFVPVWARVRCCSMLTSRHTCDTWASSCVIRSSTFLSAWGWWPLWGRAVPNSHSQDVLDMEYARRRAFNS